MAQSLREATRGRLRSMVDSLYLSCLQVRRPSHGPHVSRKRVAVIRSFEYSGLIQSREVGVCDRRRMMVARGARFDLVVSHAARVSFFERRASTLGSPPA